jgi:hypothetical protein
MSDAMGFCSYCYQSVGRDPYGYSNECFSWDAARGCSGITGPDDPIRVERKRARDVENTKNLRAEAAKIVSDAKTKAAALERQAAVYERETALSAGK